MFPVCSSIWEAFLCHFSFLKKTSYCVWGLLFPAFKFLFFPPFSFCTPKFGPRVCASFALAEICTEFFFFFSFWCAGLIEGVTLYADDWVSIFVLLVVWMRCRTLGVTSGWVILGLVFKWFTLCEWILTIWYSLALGVLCLYRVLESVFPLQMLGAGSLARNSVTTGGLLWY